MQQKPRFFVGDSVAQDYAGWTATDVIEAEPFGRIYTGLLDVSGKPIYRTPKAHPIGFDLSRKG